MRKNQQQRQQRAHAHQRSLIVGGHNIEPGRYPYFVSIDKNNGVIVNGALIAPDIVLSAGHIALNHMDNLTIKIGPYAVHENEVFAEEIECQEWLVPSSWGETVPNFFHNDYMILKLAKTSSHPLVRINRDPAMPYDGQRVVMTGLGWLTESYLSPANIVQEVELMAVDNDECKATADPKRNMTYAGAIDESMLCTKAPPNTTRDGCAWDSGAPVIIAGSSPKTDILIALGSAGVSCADPVFPAVQARVATDFGLSWIRQQVCRLSVDPPADFHCGSINGTAAPKPTTTLATTKAIFSPSSSFATMNTDGTVMIMVGCLVALLAFVVGQRVKAKLVARVEQVPLTGSHQRQSPVIYGAIDA